MADRADRRRALLSDSRAATQGQEGLKLLLVFAEFSCPWRRLKTAGAARVPVPTVVSPLLLGTHHAPSEPSSVRSRLSAQTAGVVLGAHAVDSTRRELRRQQTRECAAKILDCPLETYARAA